jgi:hypothetical protein
VQAAKAPNPATRQKGSDPNHPRRRSSKNSLLLSGILYCGYCGAAMIGNKNSRNHLYTCNRKQRQGPEACKQKSIVDYALHKLVCDWIAANVITKERLIDARDELKKRLKGSKAQLRDRNATLLTDRAKTEKRIQNLVNEIEESGSVPEVQHRLMQRRAELLEIDRELQGIARNIEDKQVELSDAALEHLAEKLREKLSSNDLDCARSIVRAVVKRIELFNEKVIAQYVVPLGDFDSQLKVGFKVCLHGGCSLIPLKQFYAKDWQRPL